MNVGSISVGMNVDLAEFQSGLQKATALASSNSALMSAEMRRQSREGAESMRLIDEAIGVHISRPLTRVIAQLPGLGKALSSLGGIGGAAGIIALIGVGWERLQPLAESIEKHFGLVGESAEESSKRIRAADEEVIKSLQRKASLQEAYNRLVLDLQGGNFERSKVEIMRQETTELEKQLVLRSQELATQITSPPPGILPSRNQLLQFLGALPGLSGWSKGLLDERTIDSIKKAQETVKPLKDQIQALDDEIKKATWTAYRDDADSAAEALKKVNAEYDKWINYWVKIGRENALKDQAAQLAQMETNVKALAATPAPDWLKSATTTQPVMPAGPPAATEAAGQLATFQEDYNAQLAKAKQIYDETVPAADKYQLALAEINVLLGKGLISQEQATAAIQKAAQEYGKQSQEMRQFAAIGMEVWKGFEDQMARALTGGKVNWKSFFQSLEADLIKFAMNQALMMLLKQLAGLGGGAGGFFGGILNTFKGGMAGGGDLTPGSSYVVGENGPELLNMGNSSGSIVSNQDIGGSIINIDARGADAGVEQRLMRAIRISEDRAVARATHNQSEYQKRVLS
jgi:hypothetical protein